MSKVVLIIMVVLIVATIFSIMLFQKTKPWVFNPDATTDELLNDPNYIPVTTKYFFETLRYNFEIEFDLTMGNYEEVKNKISSIVEKWGDLTTFDVGDLEVTPDMTFWDVITSFFTYFVDVIGEIWNTLREVLTLLVAVLFLIWQIGLFITTIILDIFDMVVKVFTLVIKVIANPKLA